MKSLSVVRRNNGNDESKSTNDGNDSLQRFITGADRNQGSLQVRGKLAENRSCMGTFCWNNGILFRSIVFSGGRARSAYNE